MQLPASLRCATTSHNRALTHEHMRTPGHCLPTQLGGSGVLVQPMTYIFDEEPLRWQRLLEELGLSDSDAREPADVAAAVLAAACTTGTANTAEQAQPARR